jgi:hypothetical protein
MLGRMDTTPHEPSPTVRASLDGLLDHLAGPSVTRTDVVHVPGDPLSCYGYECAECQTISGLAYGSLDAAKNALAAHQHQEHQQAAQPSPGGTWHLVRVINRNGAVATSWCGRALVAATKRNAKGVGAHERCNNRACSGRWPR